MKGEFSKTEGLKAGSTWARATSHATPVLGVGHPGEPKSQPSPLSTREVVLKQWSLGHCWACSCVPHPPWDKCRIQKLVENWPGSCPMTLIMKKWGLDFTHFHFLFLSIDFCCTLPKRQSMTGRTLKSFTTPSLGSTVLTGRLGHQPPFSAIHRTLTLTC